MYTVNANLVGLSCSIPSHIEVNLGDATTLSDIGIYKRPVVKNQTALDLCVHAAKRLLSEESTNIGTILFLTSTPDYVFPNNASLCQKLLNLPTDVMAIDINHACSGYNYGLYLSAIMANYTQKKVLLLDGHTNSIMAQSKDTKILFGDAGSATLVDKGVYPWHFYFETHSSDKALVADGMFRNIDTKKEMYMSGIDIFAFAVNQAPKAMKALIKQHYPMCGIDVDYFIPHQANLFMMKKIAKKLKWGKQMLASIQQYGNTGSTSIPITLTQVDRPAQLATLGFGAGLSIAAGLIRVGYFINKGVEICV